MHDSNPAAILLGGSANSIAAARSLGRRGVAVCTIASPGNPASRSRYVKQALPVPADVEREDYYREVLLDSPCLPAGSVIFPCEDRAIDFVARNKPALRERYLLDIQDPRHQLQLLDKRQTLDLARQTGCPAPRYWPAGSLHDIEDCIHDIRFPALIKPVHSHVFLAYFHRKAFPVNDREELLAKARRVMDSGIEFMVCEFIPGPDSLLNSYYVYIAADGDRLVEFTKRIIRRSPPNFGIGCYHITEWLPGTAAMGRRFFTGIGYRGMANIEFKTDLRDGQLKVIEVNARLTAAQELVTRSGIDMPWIMYQYLTRGSKQAAARYLEGMTLWMPAEDFDAFRELKKSGDLTLLAWIRSILRRQVFCFFRITDPLPALFAAGQGLLRRVRSLRRSVAWSKHPG